MSNMNDKAREPRLFERLKTGLEECIRHARGEQILKTTVRKINSVRGRMTTSQSQRAAYMIEKLKQADAAGKNLNHCRNEIITATEAEFNSSCHGCLILAVFGLYKNGFIENTTRLKSPTRDTTGFNGHESLDIRHAFDALELLKIQPELTATSLKSKLGGDHSIYYFVVDYFKNGLIRID